MDLSFFSSFMFVNQAAFILGALVALVLRVILAFAVFLDARRQVDQQRGLFLCGPGIWSFGVFVTGLIGVAIYWAIHHSTLRPRSNDTTE